MIFLQILAPLWINDHIVTLGCAPSLRYTTLLLLHSRRLLLLLLTHDLLLLRIRKLLLLLIRMGTWHGLATIEAAICWQHNAIDPVELDLVLLVQAMEV